MKKLLTNVAVDDKIYKSLDESDECEESDDDERFLKEFKRIHKKVHKEKS
jgi:hypothetical protein